MIDGKIAIAVPVRNEVERLPRLLEALARQVNAPAFSICLFFDNCEDGSEALAATLSDSLPYPLLSASCHAGGPPNAGVARRRAAELAADVAPQGMILSTDADGEPAADWVAANRVALEGSDVVAGRIRCRSAAAPTRQRLERYLDALHTLRRMLDPVPWEDTITHHWVSAASLALRTVTYRQLGGFQDLPSGEDAALADAAARAGLRLRRDGRVSIQTSARRRGRAIGGFAATLAALDEAGAEPVVTHPEDEAWRFAAQATARAQHRAGRLDHLARRLGISLAEVDQVARECPNGEAFAARIVGVPPGGLRTVPLARAEAILSILVAPLMGAA